MKEGRRTSKDAKGLAGQPIGAGNATAIAAQLDHKPSTLAERVIAELVASPLHVTETAA
jgi:hypothetical protein